MTHYMLSWSEQFVNAYVNDHEDFLFKKMFITETGTCFCNKNSPYGIITQGIFHVVYPSMNCNHFHSRRNAMAKCLHCLVSFSSTTLNVPNIWHVSIYLLICINSLEKCFTPQTCIYWSQKLISKLLILLRVQKCIHLLSIVIINYKPPQKSTLLMIKASFQK